MSSGEVDKKLFAEKSKEYSDLNEIIDDAKKYFLFKDEKNDLEKIIQDQGSDDEFKDMAETELKDLKSKNELIEKKLKLFLLLWLSLSLSRIIHSFKTKIIPLK